jgi:thymidylate synthase (FAD)
MVALMDKVKQGKQMGTVTVQKYTTTNPISLIGEEAGICWGADITDEAKNHKRGIDCIKANHGRALEFPQIYLVLDGWSAKVIREFYTHIAGGPTRLQASTRYIDYSKGFEYVMPRSVEGNEEARKVWDEFMSHVAPTIEKLNELGVKNEDATNVLPLAYITKIVVRTNLRHLIDMCHQRLCSRAYWEYRKLMREILWQLENYSDEWEELVYDVKCFKPKCDVVGYCSEMNCCGHCKIRKDAL